MLRRGENHTGGRRPRLQPLRRRVVLIAHFKVGCGGARASESRKRTYTGCTTSLLPLSLPLLRSAWTERESERGCGPGEGSVGRSSAQLSSSSCTPSLPPSLAQSFLWHRITSGTCACVVAPAAAVLLLLRSFSPSLCLCLSPLSSAPSSSHGFLQSLRSPSSPSFGAAPSLTRSVHDEIRSARNIADSSQNATITPFSAVTEEGAAPTTTKDRAE